MAHILYERLMQKGYRVFQDIESLRSGKFNTAIYEKIEQCKDVILILPPQALDRYSSQDDWARNEIAYTLEKKKNIIPVMLRGFSWPENMPEDIKNIQFFNGLTANAEYFNQFLDKLTGFFATPKKAVHTNNFGQTHHIRLWVKPDRDKNIKNFFFHIARILIILFRVSHDFIDFIHKIAYNNNNSKKRRS